MSGSLMLGSACWLQAILPVKIMWRLYTPHKSFGWDYKPRSVCTHTQRSHTVKDPVVHVRVQWIMETLMYPACTRQRVVWQSQLVFPREGSPNFLWQKSWWDKRALTLLALSYLSACSVALAGFSHTLHQKNWVWWEKLFLTTILRSKVTVSYTIGKLKFCSTW